MKSSTTRTVLDSISNLLANLFLGSGLVSAVLRLGVALTFLAIFWVFLIVAQGFPGEVPVLWLRLLPPPLYPLLEVLTPIFTSQVIVHIIPILTGALAGLYLGALYLSDLFELESIWIGFIYLLGSVFGISYPRLRIDRSEVQQLDPANPIKRIGGPGYIKIHLGYAALFETKEGLPRVYGLTKIAPTDQEGMQGGERGPQSTYFIEGFERLRDVVDLRDRLGKVDEIRAVTKDGVEVFARDAQMVFRVYGGGQERSLENPYPYTEDSVRRLVYGQIVDKNRSADWEESLPEIVRSEIRRFVARHSIEEFLALQPGEIPGQGGTETPVEPDGAGQFQIPRRELTEHFHTDELISRLREQGLELDWVGVGTWEVRDPPISSSTGDVSPGRTLMTTWRDLQRSRLYRSPDYILRQRSRRYRERTGEVINSLILTWRQGELPRQHRCYELLVSALAQFADMKRIVKLEPELALPADLNEALEHLESLIQPKVFGEPES